MLEVLWKILLPPPLGQNIYEVLDEDIFWTEKLLEQIMTLEKRKADLAVTALGVYGGPAVSFFPLYVIFKADTGLFMGWFDSEWKEQNDNTKQMALCLLSCQIFSADFPCWHRRMDAHISR